MIRRNGMRTTLLIGALVATIALGALGIAHAQQNPQKDIERIVRDFLVAFGNRDYAVFIPYYGPVSQKTFFICIENSD